MWSQSSHCNVGNPPAILLGLPGTTIYNVERLQMTTIYWGFPNVFRQGLLTDLCGIRLVTALEISCDGRPLNTFHVLWHSFFLCFWTIWNSQIAHFSNRNHFLQSLHFLKSLKNKEIQAIAQIVPFSQIGTIFSNRSKQGVGKYYIESKPPTPVSRDRINKG